MYYLQTITATLAVTTFPRLRRSISWNNTAAVDGLVFVEVGAAGQLAFSPDRVDAAVGTTLRFNFRALNHTLTRSSFSAPCEAHGEFDTGFHQFNPRNESGLFTLDYTVESEEPQYFYCAQTSAKSHCEAGMVFALNAAQRADEFLLSAKGLLPTGWPHEHSSKSRKYCHATPPTSISTEDPIGFNPSTPGTSIGMPSKTDSSNLPYASSPTQRYDSPSTAGLRFPSPTPLMLNDGPVLSPAAQAWAPALAAVIGLL